ncbi:RNA polymerase sigma factor [Cytobacillus sp. FJAT-54145]|uniref:RNA polymerase sigma factor n=1 Tax=Cytobacillus spartinae TaxID=3299023 RepID=A0ABW6KFH9_9BACI
MLQFQNGDKEAFNRLYVLLKPSLYAFLFRFTKDEQLSIDLVQDSFIKLHTNSRNYNPSKASVKTYLFQIAYHLMITKVNRRKTWQRIVPFLVPRTTDTPLYEDRITIREAISKLPESQRAVVLLSYYHEMTHSEISEVIGIPVGTVKSRLHHSIKNLRQLLEVDTIGKERAE